MRKRFCEKVFLKDGKVLLGLVEESLKLPNAKRIITSRKEYDISSDAIERIETTDQIFRGRQE